MLRTFDQTLDFVGKVATTKVQDDLNNIIREVGIKLKELELELKSDGKKKPLHKFEVASLANLIKTVKDYTFCMTPPLAN